MLSILTAIFAGEPGLAGTKISPFWILLQMRMMEVTVTTEALTCSSHIVTTNKPTPS